MPDNSVSAVFTWLSERLHDLFKWPTNLVRDFPERLDRLFNTLWLGLSGLIDGLQSTVLAVRQHRFRAWVRASLYGMAGWLHRLGNQLFDLIGGPELAQFLMHLGMKTTPLSGREIAIMESVLGPHGLRYGEVRVAERGFLDIVFRFNGNLAFSTWHTIHFPRKNPDSKRHHSRDNLQILVHELTHVYQYERVGSRYLGEAIYKLITTKRDCYDYGRAPGLLTARAAGKQYCDYNREQQAQMVQDYYALRERGADVVDYEPFMAELRSGII